MMNSETHKPTIMRKPSWLVKKIEYTDLRHDVKALLHKKGLHTVCESARCPNLSECFSHKRATFLILGDRCTRACRFCSIEKAKVGEKLPIDTEEPEKVAQSVRLLELRYVVITSVTRDDLTDGGADHFARTIRAIRRLNPGTHVEVLTPDFQGNTDAINLVLDAHPDLFNHNVETIARLYPTVRPQADFERSIFVLKYVHDQYPGVFTKSGFMVGLGETEAEVIELLKRLREVECNAVTIGQYLQPTRNHIPVKEYITPAQFELYRVKAMEMGFRYVASGPFVRSSYMAHEGFKVLEKKGFKILEKRV